MPMSAMAVGSRLITHGDLRTGGKVVFRFLCYFYYTTENKSHKIEE